MKDTTRIPLMSEIETVLKKSKQEIFLGIALLLVYLPTIFWMWDRWFSRDSYYSHGILVPFVTAFLIWQKKGELEKTAYVKSAWGMPLIVFGLIVHLASSLFRVYFTSGLSMLLVLIGLILQFYGRDVLNKVFFPIAFLVFMVPAPEVVITNISFRMKIFAAQIATALLNNMRLPAIREGSIIKMRHAYVVVDDVCSGLRSLISLTALGAIFAFWMKSSFLKKIILFLSAIPIAIVTNVVRIILLSFISEVWGPQFASGIVHDLSGLLMFGLAFVLLFSVGKLIE